MASVIKRSAALAFIDSLIHQKCPGDPLELPQQEVFALLGIAVATLTLRVDKQVQLPREACDDVIAATFVEADRVASEASHLKMVGLRSVCVKNFSGVSDPRDPTGWPLGRP